MLKFNAKTLDSSYNIRRLELEDEVRRDNFWRELVDVKIPPALPFIREQSVCFLLFPSNLVSRASKNLIKSLMVIL